jgi:hypothetical protein
VDYLIAEFVNNLLPQFVFEQVGFAGGAEHACFQDLVLAAQ